MSLIYFFTINRLQKLLEYEYFDPTLNHFWSKKVEKVCYDGQIYLNQITVCDRILISTKLRNWNTDAIGDVVNEDQEQCVFVGYFSSVIMTLSLYGILKLVQIKEKYPEKSIEKGKQTYAYW